MSRLLFGNIIYTRLSSSWVMLNSQCLKLEQRPIEDSFIGQFLTHEQQLKLTSKASIRPSVQTLKYIKFKVTSNYNFHEMN